MPFFRCRQEKVSHAWLHSRNAQRSHRESGITPSLEELRASDPEAAPGTRTVPIYREILADLETPVSAYLKISDGLRKPGFILESVEGGIRIARYSFIGADFVSTLTMRDGTIQADGQRGTVESTYDDPLAALGDILRRVQVGPGRSACQRSPAARSATSPTMPSSGSSRA